MSKVIDSGRVTTSWLPVLTTVAPEPLKRLLELLVLAVEVAADRAAGEGAERPADDAPGAAAVVDQVAEKRAGSGADQPAGGGAVGAAVEVGAAGDGGHAEGKDRDPAQVSHLSASKRFLGCGGRFIAH